MGLHKVHSAVATTFRKAVLWCPKHQPSLGGVIGYSSSRERPILSASAAQLLPYLEGLSGPGLGEAKAADSQDLDSERTAEDSAAAYS